MLLIFIWLNLDYNGFNWVKLVKTGLNWSKAGLNWIKSGQIWQCYHGTGTASHRLNWTKLDQTDLSLVQLGLKNWTGTAVALIRE